MLISKLLRVKRVIQNSFGDNIVDLISSTFSFDKAGTLSDGFIVVKEDEAMRPDLVANRIYADQRNYELLLKYNGISNPFSLDVNEILLAPPFRSLEQMIVAPTIIVEKGIEKLNTNQDALIQPKTVKDKNRIDSLKGNVKEVVPPNVNLTGNRNVKVKDGRVIFGEDVTQVNKDNCPIPISRARLIQQLTKANLF